MERTRAARWVAFAGIALALLAFVSPFMPPYSIVGWLAGASLVAPVERWWYALPDGLRSPGLHMVGTSLASAAYPLGLAVVFWLWCRPIRRLEMPYPRRTAALGAVSAIVSALYFVRSWPYGVKYQGAGLVIEYFAVNAAILAVLAILWFRYHSSRAWWPSLMIHWSLFAWICTFAFPWLGETI